MNTQYRPTEAQIDLRALRHNVLALRALLQAEATQASSVAPATLAVVKADAYGHGAAVVAPALEAIADRAGIAAFGVALVEEGIALRAAGITRPILVLAGAFAPPAVAEMVHQALTPVVYRADHLQSLASAVRSSGSVEPHPVHLKIDTGMGRIGVLPDALPGLLAQIAGTAELSLEGVLSHFANADLADDEETDAQFARFAKALEMVREAGFSPRFVHLANSAAVLARTRQIVAPGEGTHTLVRPGLALYGYAPSETVGRELDLDPVLRLRTCIAHIKQVPVGFKVSYGQTWSAKRESLIATLPVGYADGYDRRHGNGAPVLVRGQRCPVVGRVCMDLTLIDVTEVEGVKMGDEVVLIGAQGDGFVGADELAGRAGTIAYEILCAVGARVPRRTNHPE